MEGWLGWLVGLFLLEGKGLEGEMISVLRKMRILGQNTQKWEMSAVVMGEKMMTGIAKKSAVTICKLDYLVCISLIYSVL